jgi:hypothetical protein
MVKKASMRTKACDAHNRAELMLQWFLVFSSSFAASGVNWGGRTKGNNADTVNG